VDKDGDVFSIWQPVLFLLLLLFYEE